MPTLDDAIKAIRAGDKDQGRQILEEILKTDESNEEVWLWLSSVVDTDEDREICLENVLALNPDNIVAQKGLEALQSGTFNVHNLMGEALETEEPAIETTFIDEFELADDIFAEDDELVMPSTMADGSREATKKTALGGGLNIKLIVLVAFIVLIGLLALGGLAASLFLGGDEGDAGPSDGPAGQEIPAGGGEEQPAPEEIPTDTPTPLPTDTPAPTATPFQLPTAPPTALPTPTATPVVQPTVAN